MLSRAALSLKKGALRTPLSTGFFLCRTSATTSKAISVLELPDPPVIPKDGPERDLVNFPRPTRAMSGGTVRIAFLPDEWFQFFYKKTGVTGPYLFGIGFLTFVFSKEFWVIDHEFHHGVAVFLLCYISMKKFGPRVSEYFQKEMDEEEKKLEDAKLHNMNALASSIKNEQEIQLHARSQKILFDAKRENVLLQLEAEYRRRSMQVYQTFKKRLDYQLNLQESKKNIEHKHMVNWIISNVMKSITPQQEADALKKCITDLKHLATSAH